MHKAKHNQGPQEKNVFSSDLYGKPRLTRFLVLPGCFGARVKQHQPGPGAEMGFVSGMEAEGAPCHGDERLPEGPCSPGGP